MNWLSILQKGGEPVPDDDETPETEPDEAPWVTDIEGDDTDGADDVAADPNQD